MNPLPRMSLFAKQHLLEFKKSMFHAKQLDFEMTIDLEMSVVDLKIYIKFLNSPVEFDLFSNVQSIKGTFNANRFYL